MCLHVTSDKIIRDETPMERFERTLGEIRDLAEEMNRLEPSDKFVLLHDAASRIRRDNARAGLEWDRMSQIDKEQIPRPLTSRGNADSVYGTVTEL